MRNSVFKCTSDEYGQCILKIGESIKGSETEYQTLREYNGGKFCRVYQADIPNGVLLMEQIIPGTPLRVEPNLEKRLDLFCELFDGLHIEPVDDKVYPTYMDWVSQITEYMRHRSDYKVLYQRMVKAEQICCDLWTKYPRRMLLHGDLHHDNILLDSKGRYRIIDPKGVIGDPVFDIPRFIINEFLDKHDDNPDQKFAYITRVFSERFNIPKSDIGDLTYVELCMAHCWQVEDRQEPDISHKLFEILLEGK